MKKNNIEITDELLACYLEGKVTQEELAAIEAYLSENDEAVDLLILARYELGFKRVKRRFYVYGVGVLLLLALFGFLAWRLLTPLQMKVNVIEDTQYRIPALPFERGILQCDYAGNTLQTIELSASSRTVFLNDIPYHLKGSPVHIVFQADGYQSIDTVVKAQKSVELSIRRNNDLGVVFGRVFDFETGLPVEHAKVNLLDTTVMTDEQGQFRIEIPFDKQDKSQRVWVTKEGYQSWDAMYCPSATEPWLICLTK